MKEKLGLELKKSRYQWGNYYYPLNIVVFEHPHILGSYQHSNFRLGINKALMLAEYQELLYHTICHELAHLLQSHLAPHSQAHGREFREICDRYQLPKESSRAVINIKKDQSIQKKVEKLQKLINLSSSDNVHEAQAAIAFAHKMMTQQGISPEMDESDTTAVKVIAKSKRKSAKIQAIYHIISQFYVRAVFNYHQDGIYLEAIGQHHHVEIADYIAQFLNHELDHLWKEYQKEHQLKGLRAKNSFFKGISDRFCHKVSSQKNEISSRALITTEKALDHHLKKVYPRLSSSFSQAQIDPHAHQIGKKAGARLSLRPGIKATQQGMQFLTD